MAGCSCTLIKTINSALTHVVPEGVGPDRILSSQWAAAEDDEDEDEVGEDVVVDQSVTGHTNAGDRHREKDSTCDHLLSTAAHENLVQSVKASWEL